MEYFEWRGVEGVVAAELTADTTSTLTYGTPFEIAGVAELGRTTENSSETHYYDNSPAIVINSTGSDTVTLTMSGISLDVLAKITGQTYDPTLGYMAEGTRENKYFALGYKTKKTNGGEVYVWRYKGTFSIPDSQHTTEKNDTSANGASVTYTGIAPTKRFTINGTEQAVKAINVDVALGLADVSDFFTSVTLPTDLTAAEEEGS